MAIDQYLGYALEQIVNSTGTPQATLLPPLRGENRVPVVNSLRVIKKKSFVGGTEVTLGWIDPEDYRDMIEKFNIYVSTDDKPTPTVYASPQRSPGTLQLQVSTTQKARFQIQTVLKNGQVSELGVSPTISVEIRSLEEEVAEVVIRQYFPQVAVTANIAIIPGPINISLANITGPGRIIGVGFNTTQNITGVTAGTVTLSITNGINTTNQGVYAYSAGNFIFSVSGLPGNYAGAGANAGDFIYIPYNFEFENNMTISISGSISGVPPPVGNIVCTLWYCLTV